MAMKIIDYFGFNRQISLQNFEKKNSSIHSIVALIIYHLFSLLIMFITDINSASLFNHKVPVIANTGLRNNNNDNQTNVLHSLSDKQQLFSSDSIYDFAINVRNGGGEVFRQLIQSNINDDYIVLQYEDTDNSQIKQVLDFKNVSQIILYFISDFFIFRSKEGNNLLYCFYI